METVAIPAPTPQKASEWSLVLASAGIAHRTGACDVLVAGADAARAARLIATYEEENRAPAADEAPPEWGPTPAAWIAASALLAFHLVTGGRISASFWFAAGAAESARILDGELWRVVTALTLHVDPAHVAGNAVACVVFGSAVCRALGPGLGLAAILFSGAGGNLVNALVRGAGYSSVGASTALFGAVGILGALQVSRRRARRHGWRAWAPFGAALALLAWLGMSTESDVLAHAFGFVVGAVSGGVLARVPPSWRTPRAQTVFTAATVATVCLAWAAALVG